MGMYTEIYVNVDFKPNTPQHILDTVRCVTGDIEVDSERFNELMEDKPSRFAWLFHNMSYYTPSTCVAKLTKDKYTGDYSLIGKGDIKNYSSDIEAFFELIKPHVEDRFMGYMRYEESDEPVLMYAYDKEFDTEAYYRT